MFRFDSARCEFALSLHASDSASAEQALTIAMESIENTISGFYGGFSHLVQRLLMCSHCLSPVTQTTPSLFSLRQFEHALESATEPDSATLLCSNGEVSVPLRQIAPDLALSGLAVLSGVIIGTQLGSGGFGQVGNKIYAHTLTHLHKYLHLHMLPLLTNYLKT